MVAAALWRQAAARAHLACDDTAAAGTAMLTRAVAESHRPSAQLAALFALQGIGRSSSRRRARAAWERATAAVWEFERLFAVGPGG